MAWDWISIGTKLLSVPMLYFTLFREELPAESEMVLSYY